MSSCSNELTSTGSETSGKNDAVVLKPAAETRSYMYENLVNQWTSGDKVGLFGEYKATDKDSYSALTPANSQCAYASGVFTQSVDPPVKWQDADGLHNFYIYYPYASTATSNTSVPFTLSSTQTQSTVNVWDNTSAAYNFMWSSITGATRPYDRTIPFELKRLLPVAEFDVINDNDSLDGYYLKSVTITPVSGSMATGEITGGIDLTGVNSYTTGSLSFSGTAVPSYNLNINGYGMTLPAKGKSITAYMSLPPAPEQSYTIVAALTNGTITKIITTTRSDAFSITNGMGNLVRYYLNTNSSKTVFTKSDYYMWDAQQNYWYTDAVPVSGNASWYNTAYATAFQSCKNCPDVTRASVYAANSPLWDSGTALGTTNIQSYTLPNGSTYHTGLWLKKYSKCNTSNTSSLNQSLPLSTGRPGVTSGYSLDDYFFLPAAGQYNNGNLQVAGEYSYYWCSSSAGDTGAYVLGGCSGSIIVFGAWRYIGTCRWKVQ